MSVSAPKPCTWPGCSKLGTGGRCDAHRQQVAREIDQRRGSASQRGYSVAWRRAREGFLRSHPFCKWHHDNEQRFVPATVVDHIVPHKGDKDLFWRHANWQPLCKPCHDRKTATEDGRWLPTPPGGGSKV